MTMSERDEQQTQPPGDERSREEPAAATRPAPKVTQRQGDERSREEPRRRDAAAPEGRAEHRMHPSAANGADGAARTAGRLMGAMWLYTALRFGLFFALFGLLWLVGVKGFVGAVIALVLSVPLSFVLLAKPRAAFAAVLEQRVDARRARQAELDAKLRGDDDPS